MIETFDDIDHGALLSLSNDYPHSIDSFNFLLDGVTKTGFSLRLFEYTPYHRIVKILYLKNEEEFRIEKITEHYFAAEQDKQNMLGILSRAGHQGEPFLIKVRTQKTNIDVVRTLRNNLLFQFEYETTLKPDSGVELISIEKI